MATPAHCHYCFESLAAHLEHRKPLPLGKLEELWAAQQKQQQQQQQAHLPHPAGDKLSNGSSTQANGNGNGNGSSSSAGSNGSALTNGHGSSAANGAAANGHASSSYASATAALPKFPLFVTWKTVRPGGRHDLRGCIGTFEPKNLEAGLKHYAITAGVDDSRFPPITAKELPRLECGVTLLTDFEEASGPTDWTIGVHGLQIDFVYHGRRMGATYLPDVPEEQGWTQEETLRSLMRKAGWTGKSAEWYKVKLQITRYQGSRATVSWDEYRALLERARTEEEEGGMHAVDEGDELDDDDEDDD